MLSKSPNPEAVELLVSNRSLLNLFSLYSDFKEKVRNGDLGKTGQFWVDYVHGQGMVDFEVYPCNKGEQL